MPSLRDIGTKTVDLPLFGTRVTSKLEVNFPIADKPGVIAWVARYQGKWFNSE